MRRMARRTVLTTMLMAVVCGGCAKVPTSPSMPNVAPASGVGSNVAPSAAVQPEAVTVPSESGSSGPFGLVAGTALTTMRAAYGASALANQTGVFTLKTVPKPHSAFEQYAVVATEQQGLCRVIAIGKTVSTSAYGSELRSAFASLEDGLTAKYGPHETIDRLNVGSIWSEPREWMTALQKKERVLAALWSVEQGSKLSNRVTSIGLEATALGNDSGYLRLYYEFDNLAACTSTLKARADAPL
jgi:hypothetical protein